MSARAAREGDRLVALDCGRGCEDSAALRLADLSRAGERCRRGHPYQLVARVTLGPGGRLPPPDEWTRQHG